MPSITTRAQSILDQVRQLPPNELDAFIEQTLSIRAEQPRAVLSSKETVLLQRINRGLTPEFCRRFNRLIGRREKGTLTPDEHQELLRLSHDAEMLDADRADALVELAKVRRVPVRVLMKQLGIKAQPVHG